MRAITLESMRNDWPQGLPPHSLRPPQADREHFTQLLFEQFNIAGLYLGEQGVLSLYSAGKITGTVIDLGHGKTGTSSLCPLNQQSSAQDCVYVFDSCPKCAIHNKKHVCTAVDGERLPACSTK